MKVSSKGLVTTVWKDARGQRNISCRLFIIVMVKFRVVRLVKKLTHIYIFSMCSRIVIHSMMSLMISGENKLRITQALQQCDVHPMTVLEGWYTRDSDNRPLSYSRREVGFCAGWCLDNLCKFFHLFWTDTLLYTEMWEKNVVSILLIKCLSHLLA